MDDERSLERHMFRHVRWISERHGSEEASKLLPLLRRTFDQFQRAMEHIENRDYPNALSTLDTILEENRHPYLFVAEFVVQAGIHGRDALRASGRRSEYLPWALYILSIVEAQDPEIRYPDDLADAHLLLLEELRSFRGADVELVFRKAKDLAQCAQDRKDEIAGAMMELSLAHVLVEVGQFDQARQRLESGVSRMRPAQDSLIWAVRCCVLAEIEANTSRLQEAKTAAEEAEEVFRRKGRISQVFEVAKTMGDLFFSRSAWSEAGAALSRATEAGTMVYQSRLLGSERQAWMDEIGNVYRHAGYALARDIHLSGAAAVLEQGRARALNDALPCDRIALERVRGLDPKAYALYDNAAQRLRKLDTPGERISDPWRREEVRRSRKLLDEAIARVRQLPGYERFLTEPSFKDVASAVRVERPIIYAVTTTAGSLALILHRETEANEVAISPLWLDDLKHDDLSELVEGTNGWLEAQRRRGEKPEEWKSAIDRTTHVLWDVVIGPVVEWLKQRCVREATLIPGGLLGLLPLHAAWTGSGDSCRRYALDDVVLSYAPSARMASQALRIARHPRTGRLLLVDDPRPLRSAKALQFSTEEVDAVASVFEDKPTRLAGENATRGKVLDALGNADVVHFACHGQADTESPHRSGLLMAHDEYVTVRDILEFDGAGGRLATLSACETGVIGRPLPDEAIGLPGALMRAGYAGILGSLWAVGERSTALLMRRFYELWRDKGLEPAWALRRAQQWVRDASIEEKADYCRPRTRNRPDRTTEPLHEHLTRCRPDFSHPCHWAAFCLTGV